MAMKMLILRIVLSVGLGVTAVAHAADSAAGLVQAGRAKLDQGDPSGALLDFRHAITADPQSSDGYFYGAIASYRLGNLDEAASLGDEALQRANGAQAGRIREVVQLIKQKRTAATKLSEGDAAYGDGLMAKAAQAYAEAFAADPSSGETGLKAAGLFADRLNRLLDAAVIWQQVVQQGGESAQTANDELSRRHTALVALLDQALRRESAWRRSRDVAEPLRLARAFPDHLGLQLILAGIYAERREESQTLEHLKQASRLGMSFEDFVRQDAVLAFMGERSSEPLSTFVNDAFGPDRLAEVRDRIAHAAAEQRRLAEQKAEEGTLPAWRDEERNRLVQELAQLLANPEPVRENEFGKRWIVYHTPIRLSLQQGEYQLTSVYDRDVEDTSLRATVPNVRLQKWFSFARFTQLKQVSFEPLVFTRRLLDLKITFTEPRLVWHDKYDRHAKPAESYSQTLTEVHLYTSAGWEDANAKRILQLFQRLQQLDAAGSDPVKLRALKHSH